MQNGWEKNKGFLIGHGQNVRSIDIAFEKGSTENKKREGILWKAV